MIIKQTQLASWHLLDCPLGSCYGMCPQHHTVLRISVSTWALVFDRLSPCLRFAVSEYIWLAKKFQFLSKLLWKNSNKLFGQPTPKCLACLGSQRRVGPCPFFLPSLHPPSGLCFPLTPRSQHSCEISFVVH